MTISLDNVIQWGTEYRRRNNEPARSWDLSMVHAAIEYGEIRGEIRGRHEGIEAERARISDELDELVLCSIVWDDEDKPRGVWNCNSVQAIVEGARTQADETRDRLTGPERPPGGYDPVSFHMGVIWAFHVAIAYGREIGGYAVPFDSAALAKLETRIRTELDQVRVQLGRLQDDDDNTDPPPSGRQEPPLEGDGKC